MAATNISSITASQRAYINSLQASVLEVWNVTQNKHATLEGIRGESLTEERLMLALAYESLKKTSPDLANQMLQEVARERLRLKKQHEQDPAFKALDRFLQNARKNGLLTGQKASAVMRYALGKSELSEGIVNISDKRVVCAEAESEKSNLEVCVEKTLRNKSATGDELIVARYLSRGKVVKNNS